MNICIKQEEKKKKKKKSQTADISKRMWQKRQREREKEMWMTVINCELLQEGKSKSHIQLDYNNKRSINVGHLSIYRRLQ